MNRIEKIVLNKQQTAFIGKDNCNTMGVISGTVEEIASLFFQNNSIGCKIVFDTTHAPNFKRCFNSYVKRAMKIAEAAGVSVSNPEQYRIDGFDQTGKFVLEVIG